MCIRDSFNTVRRGKLFGYYRSAVLNRELFPAFPLAQPHKINKLLGFLGDIEVYFKLLAVLQNEARFGMDFGKAFGIFAEIIKRGIISGIGKQHGQIILLNFLILLGYNVPYRIFQPKARKQQRRASRNAYNGCLLYTSR